MQILEEFYNIFGPELKAVTGDPKRIDDVLRWVDSLVVPIEELSFDPFNIRKMGSWKMVMQDFKDKVQVGAAGHPGRHFGIHIHSFIHSSPSQVTPLTLSVYPGYRRRGHQLH